MRRTGRNIFLILSVLAITLMMWDFVCGHMDESPFAHHTCPLCAAYQSVEMSGDALSDLALCLIFILIGYYCKKSSHVRISCHFRNLTLRAPPAS